MTVTWSATVSGFVSLLETIPAKFDQASTGSGASQTPGTGSISPPANGAFAVATSYSLDTLGSGHAYTAGSGWTSFQNTGGGAADEGGEYLAQVTAAPLSGNFTTIGGTWVDSMADFVPVVPNSSVQFGDLNGAAGGA